MHHNVIAQPHFPFLPKALKVEQIQLNQELQRELDKIR